MNRDLIYAYAHDLLGSLDIIAFCTDKARDWDRGAI